MVNVANAHLFGGFFCAYLILILQGGRVFTDNYIFNHMVLYGLSFS